MSVSFPTIPLWWREAVTHFLDDADFSTAERRVAELAARLDVTPLEVLTGGRISLTVRCSGEMVLKGALDERPLRGEAEALGSIPDAPRVLAVEEYAYAMEELTHSGDISLEDLRRAFTRVASVPPPPQAAPLSKQIEGRIKSFSKERADLTNYGELRGPAGDALRKLSLTGGREALLHGDPHRENMIPTSRGPVLIDPMLARGDHLFDPALFIACGMHGPIDWLELLEFFADGLSPDERARFERWVVALTVIESRPESDKAEDTEARERVVRVLGYRL